MRTDGRTERQRQRYRQTDRQTDGHDEANSRYSHYYTRTYKGLNTHNFSVIRTRDHQFNSTKTCNTIYSVYVRYCAILHNHINVTSKSDGVINAC